MRHARQDMPAGVFDRTEAMARLGGLFFITSADAFSVRFLRARSVPFWEVVLRCFSFSLVGARWFLAVACLATKNVGSVVVRMICDK